MADSPPEDTVEGLQIYPKCAPSLQYFRVSSSYPLLTDFAQWRARNDTNGMIPPFTDFPKE